MAKRKRKRNYKAEYAARLKRAAALGYSKSVARGHAKKGEIPLKVARAIKVKPGTSEAARPTVPHFTELLEQHGFRDYLTGLRERVLERELAENAPEGDQLEFEATSQEAFVQALIDAGVSEREAYNQWFSPK